MTDYVQLQSDLYHLLLSAENLRTVNIVSFRKLRMSSEVEFSTLWQAPRNGCAGAGVLVHMPEVETMHGNLPGPEFVTTVPLSVVEEPNQNFAPGGSYLSAEEIAQRVAELLHGYAAGVWGGALYAKGPVIQPDSEFPAGLLAYRVQLHLRLMRTQVARVATPTISQGEGGAVTLACGTSGASIYYTTDGSFPGPGNAAATLYAEPFTAEVGTRLRFGAYGTVLLPSMAEWAELTPD